MTSELLHTAHACLPEISLILGALLVLGIDLAFGRRLSDQDRLRTACVLGVFAVFAAIYHTVTIGSPGPVFGGAFLFDRLALATRVGVLVLAQLTLLISVGARLRNPAEFVAILLFATTGLLLMATAHQLLLGFLAVELTSLSLYVLAGFDKTKRESAEAALKYFLVGGISSAFLLFGFSLIYGLTGSIQLPVIARQLASQPLTPLLVVALVMVVVAFGFKVAAAPFHLWAPDVYEGAPTPATALIASASKLAGFAFFARLFWVGFNRSSGTIATAMPQPGWMIIVAILVVAALLVGNFGALAQSNVRRLLAYSAIANAGAILLGVLAVPQSGYGPLVLYATTYGLATVGTFGVIAILERSGRCETFSDLTGLHRRSPLLAGCLLVFVLSLAGIPPLAGFVGKFSVFAAALKLNGLDGVLGWITVLAILLSAVALYYYLLILKAALVTRAPAEATKVRPAAGPLAGLLIAATLLIVLGVYPSLLLGLL